MRFKKDTEFFIFDGTFDAAAANVARADINILGMPPQDKIAWARDIFVKLDTSLLFLQDSKQENVFV